MDFIHVRVLYQENAAGFPLSAPLSASAFGPQLESHALRPSPFGPAFGYHHRLSAFGSAFSFPLQDHSPGTISFGFQLSAPLSAIAFITTVALPFGPAFSLPLCRRN